MAGRDREGAADSRPAGTGAVMRKGKTRSGHLEREKGSCKGREEAETTLKMFNAAMWSHTIL